MTFSTPQLPEDPDDALTALKTLAAHSAHLHFAIAGNQFDAISFEGSESISTPFSATLWVLAQLDEAWLGQPAVVALTDASGNVRTLAGVVTYQRERGHNARKQSRVEVKLQPRLWLLSQTRDNRVIQGLTIPALVTRILAQHDIDSDSAIWHLSNTYPVCPYLVQYAESDLAFIERLLAGIGISYWFGVEDGRDVLHFTDDNAAYTALKLGVVPFISDAGLHKPIACFTRFTKGSRKVSAHAQVVDYNYMTPDHLIKAGQGPAANDPAMVHYGAGTVNQDEAEQRVRLIDERYAVAGVRIQISGSVAGLTAGSTFRFVHPGHPPYSGDYLVVGLGHTLIQQAVIEHESDIGNLAYTCTAQLIPRSLPYRPALKPAPRLPAVYTARIESNGQYALLDEQGRFKVRHLFDTRSEDEAAHTEASLPVRSLSFHGSPAKTNTVGAAFPFRDDVEVLWASVDGNPNQPIIIGSVPNPATQSPVTSRNFGDHIIRTGARNELLLHDIKDEEHIELKQGDYDRPFNLMRLDANSAGHSIKFATTLGAMEIYAKQTMKVEAGDSLTQTHGNDRTETVENSHRLTTKNKDIHYQSATDQSHHAGQNIVHKAEKNIEHRSTGATQWRVNRHARITIKQGDQIIRIENGSLHIQAAQAIKITGTGSGSIRIGQKGAGIEIDAGGNVRLRAGASATDHTALAGQRPHRGRCRPTRSLRLLAARCGRYLPRDIRNVAAGGADLGAVAWHRPALDISQRAADMAAAQCRWHRRRRRGSRVIDSQALFAGRTARSPDCRARKVSRRCHGAGRPTQVGLHSSVRY